MVAALPFIPYLAALFILLIPAAQEKLLRWTALTATAACLLVTLFLTNHFNRALPGYQFVQAWDVFSEAGIRYQVGLDGINLVFCLLLAIVGFASAFTAAKVTTRLKEYLFYFLILVGSMFAVFTTLNIFFLYVFYEMTLVPIIAMLAIAGVAPLKEKSALYLTVYMALGAIIGLFAIINLYDILGPDFLDLTQTRTLLAAKASLLTPDTQKWLASFLIVGFGIMTSLWPFHSWSPTTYSAAPASLSMVHAGVKVGPYILIRIALAYLPAGFQYWAPALAVFATIGVMHAGYTAMKQTNLKTMAAFSSVSHMGYVLLALAAMNAVSLSASIFLVFAHGIMTACLFALIGHLENESQSDGIHDFGGLGKSMPFFAVAFMLTGMASSGIPGFANFPAELLIFISSWKTFPVAVIFGVFSVPITAIYMIRAVQAICFGESNAHQVHLKDIRSFFDKTPFLILLAVLCLFGFFPSALLSVIQPAIERLL